EASPEAFKAANRKGDGRLTLEEYINALYIDFDKADTDRDGSLTLEEIQVYVRSSGRRSGGAGGRPTELTAAPGRTRRVDESSGQRPARWGAARDCVVCYFAPSISHMPPGRYTPPLLSHMAFAAFLPPGPGLQVSSEACHVPP